MTRILDSTAPVPVQTWIDIWIGIGRQDETGPILFFGPVLVPLALELFVGTLVFLLGDLLVAPLSAVTPLSLRVGIV